MHFSKKKGEHGKLAVRNERQVKSPIALLGQVWYCLISASAATLRRNDTQFKPVVTHKQHSTYQQEQPWGLTCTMLFHLDRFQQTLTQSFSQTLYQRNSLSSFKYTQSWAGMKKMLNSVHSEALQIRSLMKVLWDFHINRLKKLRINKVQTSSTCIFIMPSKLPVLHLSLLALLREIIEMNLGCYILKRV